MAGASGWLAIGAPALEACGQSLDVSELAAGTVVCAGAAMLPDLDHPQASVSQSLGPVTQGLSRGFSTALGGHRNGSHSLLFALVVGTAMAVGLATSNGPWLALGTCFFFSSLVIRTLTDADGVICAAVSGIIGATLVSVAPNMDWICFAVFIGCLLHDLGDVLTPEGVPPLWPVSKKRVRFPVIGSTGDIREKGIAGACGIAACYLLAVNVYMPIWHSQQSQKKSNVAREARDAGGQIKQRLVY